MYASVYFFFVVLGMYFLNENCRLIGNPDKNSTIIHLILAYMARMQKIKELPAI